MKKLINAVENVVREQLQGMAVAHPELVVKIDPHYVYRKEIPSGKVALVSGGGSGHEPMHGGFVGYGMLDGACPGEVFTSPTPDQMYECAKAVDRGAGVLFIVKNYTGDVMNFETAAELCHAEGIKVQSILIDDDVAVKDSLYTVGRRGVAGTIFVHKIAGAAAEEGRDLAGVKAVAEKVIANVRSLGFAFTSCTVPAKGSPTFKIADDEIEFGVGIHGEPGIAREKMQTAGELAYRMVEAIAADLPYVAGNEVALMVNGLGNTPLQELYLLNNSVTQELEARELKIYRTFVGNYMTSIDMAGASVTLLKLDDELKALLDAPADTPALKV